MALSKQSWEINPEHASDPLAQPGQRGSRAVRLGRFLHITYHSLPSPRGSRLAVVLALFGLWHRSTSAPLKLRALVASCCYTVMEFCFTRGFTTFAQFWANVLYTPFLLDGYHALFRGNPLLYIGLYPLNIWILEIIEGYFLKWFYGRNVAWYYPTNDAYFHGNIRMGHAPVWLALGTLVYFILDPATKLSRKLVG